MSKLICVLLAAALFPGASPAAARPDDGLLAFRDRARAQCSAGNPALAALLKRANASDGAVIETLAFERGGYGVTAIDASGRYVHLGCGAGEPARRGVLPGSEVRRLMTATLTFDGLRYRCCATGRVMVDGLAVVVSVRERGRTARLVAEAPDREDPAAVTPALAVVRDWVRLNPR